VVRKKQRPLWLYTALTILLLVLGLMVWLGAGSPRRSTQGSIAYSPKSPSVVYEDVQRLSALKALDGTRNTKQKAHPSQQGIALILDDVGYNLKELKRALKLPYPIAISVIPDAPYAVRAAEMAHASGHIVMLHLPMEPFSPKYSHQMDSAFLRVGMSRDDVRRIMLGDLARIPYVAGVNNHMGSRLTTLKAPMRWVMNICREKGLFFVDSRTSKNSVAAELAREAGLSWGERRVFLDNSLRTEDMEASWRIARRKASRHIPVIVIAHPHDATLNFLETHVEASDVKHIFPLKRILFAARTIRFVARKSLNMHPAMGRIHVESNAD